MQILAAGGIFGATFRMGEAPSALENRRFAIAGESRELRASFEIEVLFLSTHQALMALGD